MENLEIEAQIKLIEAFIEEADEGYVRNLLIATKNSLEQYLAILDDGTVDIDFTSFFDMLDETDPKNMN